MIPLLFSALLCTCPLVSTDPTPDASTNTQQINQTQHRAPVQQAVTKPQQVAVLTLNCSEKETPRLASILQDIFGERLRIVPLGFDSQLMVVSRDEAELELVQEVVSKLGLLKLDQKQEADQTLHIQCALLYSDPDAEQQQKTPLEYQALLKSQNLPGGEVVANFSVTALVGTAFKISGVTNQLQQDPDQKNYPAITNFRGELHSSPDTQVVEMESSLMINIPTIHSIGADNAGNQIQKVGYQDCGLETYLQVRIGEPAILGTIQISPTEYFVAILTVTEN
ncbi:MAG: hypothetical protein HJJLKODD_00858 [Phycisphaerae bacterium]|nr:hypothetical protein [Phycisphaerae bacterium]